MFVRPALAFTLTVSVLVAASPATPAAPQQATTTLLAGEAYGDGLDARRATLVFPWGVVATPRGLAISDNWHHQIRLLRPDGTIDRLAGTGEGFGGDGKDADRAQLNRPRGLALDTRGDLLIADAGNSRIRKVDLSTGIIRTIAGSGVRGYGGDGGPATQAALAFPYDVTADGLGNVYIADYENFRIRRVSTGGTITTIAGTGDRNAPANPQVNDFDGVPAATAHVRPTAVLAGPDGDLYFGDAFGCRVRHIDRQTKTVTTVAGTGCGNGGDGGPATEASFGTIHDLAFDPQGRLVIADGDNNRIRRIETDGTVTTVVGDGSQGCPGDGAASAGTAGTWPVAIAYDEAGRLHYASQGCNRTYATDGSALRHTAGRGGGLAGDPGDPAAAIEFSGVEAVAWGPDGRPYFSDVRGIWTIDEEGRAQLVAGGTNGDADGPALEAKFRRIRGLEFDETGALWIADLGAGKVKRLRDGIVETMAGNPAASDATVGTDGPALSIKLHGVIDVGVAPGGTVYFNEATEVNGRVRELRDGRISLVAGPRDTVNRYLEPIGDGGPGAGALFRYLRGLEVTSDGSLLAVDSQHHRIRRIVPGGSVTTFAGDGGEASRGDGTVAELASFSSPEDVVADAQGNVFVTDGKNEYTGQPALYTIRHIAPNGMVSTIAGTGASAQGQSGPSLQTPLSNPAGLAIGPKGLLVADTTGVRLITPPAGGWPRPERDVSCERFFTDVEGDARAQYGVSFVYGPNMPWADLLWADVTHDAQTLTVTMQFLDLNERVFAPPGPELGTAWSWTYFFKADVGDGAYRYLAAIAPPDLTSPAQIAFEYGTSGLGRGSATKNVTRRGAATGTFDLGNDRITITAPLSAVDLQPGDTVLYHEATGGELIDVGVSRFVNPDDTTLTPGFLEGTGRSYTIGRPCPQGY